MVYNKYLRGVLRKLFLLLSLPLTLTAQEKLVLNGNEDALAQYLTTTIEADQLNNPAGIWYSKSIKPGEISEYRDLFWMAWKKANAARLSTWPSLKAQEVMDSLIWELPTAKKALFALRKKGSKPEGGYPMFINLHGGGTFPDTKTAWGPSPNDGEWKAAKMLGARYADTPSLYFVPRMADDRRGRWYHKGEQIEFIRAWQLGVLSGDVNPDKVYITGISEGGYGSFRMGPFFADYFAGSGPMAGVSYANEAPLENMRNTPFYIAVGAFDYAYGRALGGAQWKKQLDSASKANAGQFVHVVDIQQGKGHGIDYFKTTPWLKQYIRNPYPDTLSFQYYAVHDTVFNRVNDTSFTYRKGFGYLRLDGLSQMSKPLANGFLETAVRDFYVEKRGNTYRVKSTNRIGNVTGVVSLYFDHIDFSKPVVMYYNGRQIHKKKVVPNLGVMAESLALFGDPKRIFAAKLEIKIE